MEVIYAVGITMLFSAWIWTLKQELAGSQREMMPASGRVHRIVAGPISGVLAGSVDERAFFRRPHKPKPTDDDVATWELK